MGKGTPNNHANKQIHIKKRFFFIGVVSWYIMETSPVVFLSPNFRNIMEKPCTHGKGLIYCLIKIPSTTACLHDSLSMYLSLNMYLSLYMSLRLYICLNLYTYLSLYKYLISTRIWVCTRTWDCTFVWICTRVWIYL